MSAEKDIVKFWLESRGFFTVSNIKVGNKSVDLLAIKVEQETIQNIYHVEVCCSVSGFPDHQGFVDTVLNEKFDDEDVRLTVHSYAKHIGPDVNIERMIVLNSLPKDKKAVQDKILSYGIALFELEDILAEVMQGLKTSYYKDDVLRTLQIMYVSFLTNPQKLVDVLYGSMSQQKMREFLAELLSRDEIIKEFKKTNEERLAILLKQAMIKPERLAQMLEQDVLNQRTRKPFIDSMLELGGVERPKEQEVKDKPLRDFFKE